MSRKRILVVDDDRSVLQLYRTALALSGFTVDTAEDGLGALRKIEAEPPNLIVLDLNMPRVDGFTVLSDVRANSGTSSIPVVVVTGQEPQDDVPQASATLKKPCEPEELISAIEHHIHAAA